MAVDTVRPDADVSIGSWTDDGGGTTSIFQAIDEVSASETDFIRSESNPSLSICEIGLSDPGAGTIADRAHVLSYRYQKSASAGRTIELRARLLQGATEIASFTHAAISDAIAQADQTLTPEQVALITDYTDLRVEFRGDTSGSGAGRRAQVSWAELIIAEESVKSIGTTSRDYSTITLWEAAIDNTTYPNANTVAKGECYNDSAFDEGPTIDAAPTNVTGIVLTAAAGEEHDGTAGTGVRIVATTGRVFTLNNTTPTIEVSAIEFDENGNNTSKVVSILGQGRHVRRCLFHDIDRPGTIEVVAITSMSADTPATIVSNCVIYDINSTGDNSNVSRGIVENLSNTDRVTQFFNNTIHDVRKTAGTGNADGLFCAGADNTVQNNIATDTSSSGGTASDYNVTSPGTESHNLASDTTASGTGSLDSKTATDQFVSTVGGSEDFHLKSGADAIDAGTDLGVSPFGVNIDIDGRDRDAEGDTWDMGAHEFVAAAGGTSSFQLERRFRRGQLQGVLRGAA